MPTAALKFAPILVLLAPTMVAAQQAGASAARATMAVSLTVADGSVAKPFDGERFVSGKGAVAKPCNDCVASPPPRLLAKVAASSGFRPSDRGRKLR